MSTTIDSLDIKITTSAGAAEAKIDQLARALGRLKENGKIGVATNSLKRLADALGQLNPALSGFHANKLQQLATAMNGLASVQKLSGLNNAVNTLKKIPDVMNNLDETKLQKFTTQMKKLSDALEPLATQLDKVGTSFSRLPSQVSKVVTATNRMDKANKQAAKSTGELDTSAVNLMANLSNLGSIMGVIDRVATAMATVMNEAMQWEGIQFRFGRAFGEDAEDVYQYIQKVNDALDINIQQFMQYSSLYGSLLSGFGLEQEKVTTISVGLTELSYDIWAAYNDRFKTLEDASEAVRSAITGEIEPIRNAGVAMTEASMQEFIDGYDRAAVAVNDVTTALEEVQGEAKSATAEVVNVADMITSGISNASLQATADTLGLEVSVEKLTEAQKTELRYAVMTNAALNQGIVGTYAAEMTTAEGAVRNLTQNLKTLTQTFGSLFIPILQLVIPYLTAFVQLLTEAVHWVANLFGIELFKIDWGSSAGAGVNEIATGAEEATDGLNKAAKAAKKLKDYTMGFDELNVINPPDPSSGGSGGAGAGGVGDSGWGDGLDLDTLWDDSVFAKASAKVDEIKERVKALLPWIALIGGAFLAWKVAPALIKGFTTLKKVASVLGGVFTAVFRPKVFGPMTAAVAKITGGISKLAGILTKGVFAKGLGAVIMGKGGGSLLAAVGAITAFVAGVGLLVVGLADVVMNSELFQQGIAALGDIIAWVTGGIANLAKKVFPDFNFSLGGIDDKIQELTGGFIGLGDIAIAIGGLVLFGPWGLAIEGVVLAIKGLGKAFGDAIPQVDLFGEGVSDATKAKVEPFLEKIDELDQTIKRLDWSNVEITVGDLEDVERQLDKIVDTITTELDSDKNEALSKLEPLREAFGDTQYEELINSVNASYEKQTQIVLDGEARITEIVQSAADENRALTDEEAKEIAKIQQSMRDTGIKYLSESETESNLILQRLKDNASALSAEQASEIIKNAATSRDETIKSAEEQYKGILLEAQRMLDTGTISKEEYDKIVAAAEETKTSTVKNAETQYDDILKTAKSKMGEYSKYIDDETGELKSKWEVWTEELGEKWSTFWTNFKKKASEKWGEFKSLFNTTVKPLFTKKYWSDLFDGVKRGVSEKLNEAWEKIKDFFDISEWKKKVEDAIGAIKENFKLPEFPKIKLTVTWDTNVGKVKTAVYKALGLDGWPNLKWGTYAQGGLPAMGEMFIARENGPELVGNIGNRSAVVNNDQIVEAVSRGVYSAVAAAMSANNGNGSQNVNVYLDGKQIYSRVKKVESERGVSVMGSQLGYAY